METFIQKHAAKVIGVLSGFDRLVFRGTLRSLSRPAGMLAYLWHRQVLLKEFKPHVTSVTRQINQALQRLANEAQRPLVYLKSAATRKEDLVRGIVERDGVKQGLICILSSVEPCPSFEVYRNRATKKLELQSRWRKCKHYYQYWLDPELGLLNARLQSWFPFNIQICLNGREWLARQMDQAQLRYVKLDNCFSRLADLERAQALMDQQLRSDWPALLNGLAARLNPVHHEIFRDFPVEYYWAVHQSEWATDVMFRDRETLAALSPALLRHGITSFGSPDVLRFLGHKVPATGEVHGCFTGEVTSDLKRRPEGVRIKHRCRSNSVKLYDKQGMVLRVETTLNDPRDFKVFRPREGQALGDGSWMRMRKGVADLQRRTQVSQAANERYLEALAAVEAGEPLGELAEKLCRPVVWHGERYRALNPYAPEEAKLLELVNRGEYALNGFRNRDLREQLYPAASTSQEARRRSSKVTRQLRLLRAHGLIKKVSRTQRYQLTTQGRQAITALLTARNSDVNKLMTIAA